MESLALFVDEEWDNLSRMFSNDQEDHYSNQLHGSHGLFPVNVVATPASFWSIDESNNAGATVFDDGLFLNYPFSSQENSSGSGTSSDTNTNLSLPTPTPTYENYYNHSAAMPNYSDQSSMDFCGMDDKNSNFLGQVFSDDVMEEMLCLKQAGGKMENNFDGQQMGNTIADHPRREMPLKRKFEIPEELPQAPKDEVVQIDPVEKNPKKKQRVTRENNKNKKSAQTKKNQKHAIDTNGNEGELETVNGGGNVPSSTSYCSEEDDSNSNSNGSQESNGEGALNLNGKTRASRGAATDPQSLYARKRRERINERLRILQNLVPNGTKVDISTMLEEAVHYVKFLQLQIKLLSSDDMWMYAPIAYNGMDMGLYQRISASAQ